MGKVVTYSSVSVDGFIFVDGIETAMATAQQLAGEPVVEVGARAHRTVSP